MREFATALVVLVACAMYARSSEPCKGPFCPIQAKRTVHVERRVDLRSSVGFGVLAGVRKSFFRVYALVHSRPVDRLFCRLRCR